MLSKFSVKKPMTVFVCVVLVLVLGVVSFFRMTPDLLPNMDFPYAIIMTTYGGQTPETVEATVSKPLEQSFSTIDGVKEITSTSSENYSLVMIEFQDGTNMDTATVDIRSSLDTISDAWPDGVGTPYLIKVNPNIMPVSLVAVDYGDKSRDEISEYVEKELMNKLEGIDGVASVSTKGLVTANENVVISQKKLDKLNSKISAALNDQFGEAEDKLNEAKNEIDNNIKNAESGANTITSSIDDINKQQEQVAKQLEDAQLQADNGKSQLLGAKMQLLDQKTSLTQTKQTLEIAYQALLELKSTYDDLMVQKTELTNKISTLTEINDKYISILEQMKGLSIVGDEFKALKAQLDEIDKQLEPYNITKEQLAITITVANTALSKVNTSIEELNTTLSELGTSTDSLDSAISDISGKLTMIEDGISQIDTAINGLDDQSVTVNQALATISAQRSSADFKMSAALTTLTSKQSEVNSALAQLNSAQTEIQKNLDTLSDQKEEAMSKADVNSTVTIDNISGILTAQNFNMPAGYVSDDKNNKYMVRVGDKVQGTKELSDLVLFDTGIKGIGVIKLSDVADVFHIDNSDEVYAKINGNPGVIVSFSKQSNTATSKVCENINTELAKLSEETKDLKFTNLYNQGDYIELVVNSVIQNLLSGAVLAIIILLIFLRDIKPTLIVAISIPVSVVFAIVLMYFSGISLNMISLSGLAIGVGMLVDNSVVVIENIYRLRSMGISPIKAALNGANQVAGAIVASTLTTICVFFPIVFVEGITRDIFVDMALTIAYSLLASLIIALTLVPAMSQGMLRKIKNETNKKPSKILNAYEKSLRFVLNHKVVTILVTIALLFSSISISLLRGFSFMPEMSSPEIQVTVTLDVNATLEETVETAEQLNKILEKYDQFETVGVMTGGTSSLMGLSAGAGSDAGSLMAYCVLKDEYTKECTEISKNIENDCKEIDGEVEVLGGSTGSMSTLLGGTGVQVVIYGDDLEQLKTTAEDMAEKLKTIPGIDETDSGVGATSPEIKVTVDKAKAAKYSLTVAQVYQQVASAIAEEKTSTTLTNNEGDEVNVVVIKDESQKTDSNSIENIVIKSTTPQGEEKSVKLWKIAEVSKSEAMDTISRQNQKRFLSVSGTIKEGYTTTGVTNEVKALFNDYKLPTGFTLEYSGADEVTMEAVNQMLQMMGLGIVLIYLIMVAQFQSLKSPFIIMFTIPLAFTGGFLGLIITGFDVSVVSLIGFVMLCGIIVNNGIVLVDYINQLRLEGKDKTEAMVEAGRTRMRPIMITALTTVLGLSVMAMGIGTGAEMMQPLAIVCIGGLLYATLMTLYIIPVIYDIFNKKELKKIDETELEYIDD